MSEDKVKTPEEIIEKYSWLYWNPFLTWIFMWVNAIKDAALFVDWPDCVFYKADMLFKTHDIYSELKQASVDTKLYFSWVMPNKMIRWYDDKIKRKLWFIDNNPKFNLWIVTCMPVTGLLATQYDNIYGDFDKDFIFVPSFTDKFWIDWYSIFLRELAKSIKIDEKKDVNKDFEWKNNLSVSLIWYLFDRNEWDCLWNIEEIKRILWLLDISIDSIWLDWSNYENLSKVQESELLISLPYWKYASKILNKRLNIDILELDVPFWLQNTINFVKLVWEKLWIESEKIDSIINNEFRRVKEKIDMLDDKRFLNKNYIYAWDPFLDNSIKDIWKMLWMNCIKTYSYTWTQMGTYDDIWDTKVDLIIWNSIFNYWDDGTVKFEFWFPSYNTHFLLNRPYMWFNGLLFFIERLYHQLLKEEDILF